MGLFFIENPVAASTLARHLNSGISPKGANYNVVFLRDPVQRFWSGVKKDYTEGSYTDKIASALQKLGEGHLIRQVDSIAGKPVAEVVTMDDSFQSKVATLLEKHDVTWVRNFSVDYAYAKNASQDTTQDSAALAHIQNDAEIMGQLKDYYAEDFAWWDSLNTALENA